MSIGVARLTTPVEPNVIGGDQAANEGALQPPACKVANTVFAALKGGDTEASATTTAKSSKITLPLPVKEVRVNDREVSVVPAGKPPPGVTSRYEPAANVSFMGTSVV